MMRKYKLYFEFYGKKMQTTVTASSEKQAKEFVRNNINFLKVVHKEDTIDFFKNIFGM